LRGSFIVFEGCEGSGKSTQIRLLAERLESMGYSVVTTREPGGTPAGSAIRQILLSPETGALDPMTELLLFLSARRELVKNVVVPALEKGEIVLCDRFSDSTMAYQGYGRGLDKKFVSDLNSTVLEGLKPDRVVVLDLPVEEGLGRANGRMMGEGRGEARFEDEDIEFHKRVRDGFLKIAAAEPDRIKVVDAASAIGEVSANVFKAIEDSIPAL